MPRTSVLKKSAGAAAILAVTICVTGGSQSGRGYDDLVKLFDEFLAFDTPKLVAGGMR